MYLIRNAGSDRYTESGSRSEAYMLASNVSQCAEGDHPLLGNPSVTFETESLSFLSDDVYLTVTCLAHAPTVWARVTVAIEEREALRLAS